MKFKQHIFAGVIVTLPILYISKVSNININYGEVLICSIIGSLLPDIDHPKSFLGSKIQPFSQFINQAFGHRTFTHSLLFITLVYTVTMFINPNISIGYCIGMLSHVLLDMLTPTGVSIYYPFYKNRIKCNQKK